MHSLYFAIQNSLVAVAKPPARKSPRSRLGLHRRQEVDSMNITPKEVLRQILRVHCLMCTSTGHMFPYSPSTELSIFTLSTKSRSHPSTRSSHRFKSTKSTTCWITVPRDRSHTELCGIPFIRFMSHRPLRKTDLLPLPCSFFPHFDHSTDP